MQIRDIPSVLLERFRDGTAIPAMPLALQEDRSFDPVQQQAVLRYYMDAGVGGIAVGVHSTQFGIRNPEVGLFEPVLEFASQVIDDWCRKRTKAILKIAGVCGATDQACDEARFAVESGYHACLLSLAALRDRPADELLLHCRQVAAIMPVIGFYLQPSVGGAVLPYAFWRDFVETENLLGIKLAPFNRYQTFDVVRAVADAGREADVTLYTGNDDNIVVDLLTRYEIRTGRGPVGVQIRGGLLGHWGVWTRKAVELLDRLKLIRAARVAIPRELLTLAAQVTDMNAAVFDAANGFAGCIPGIHEVLRRQGLLRGIWCLDPHETLSPGQSAELDRVQRSYPHLCDDEFVREHLQEWSGACVATSAAGGP